MANILHSPQPGHWGDRCVRVLWLGNANLSVQSSCLHFHIVPFCSHSSGTEAVESERQCYLRLIWTHKPLHVSDSGTRTCQPSIREPYISFQRVGLNKVFRGLFSSVLVTELSIHSPGFRNRVARSHGTFSLRKCFSSKLGFGTEILLGTHPLPYPVVPVPTVNIHPSMAPCQYVHQRHSGLHPLPFQAHI